MSKNSVDSNVVTIRFAGDSGDGMQLTGGQFSENTAIFGNDLSTLPDFPAEIRAPQGTLYGVSSFQLQFGSRDVYTAGDDLDVLGTFRSVHSTHDPVQLHGQTYILAPASFRPSSMAMQPDDKE